MFLTTNDLLVIAVSEDRISEIPMEFYCDDEFLMFIKTFIHNAEDGSHLRIERGTKGVASD